MSWEGKTVWPAESQSGTGKVKYSLLQLLLEKTFNKSFMLNSVWNIKKKLMQSWLKVTFMILVFQPDPVHDGVNHTAAHKGLKHIVKMQKEQERTARARSCLRCLIPGFIVSPELYVSFPSRPLSLLIDPCHSRILSSGCGHFKKENSFQQYWPEEWGLRLNHQSSADIFMSVSNQAGVYIYPLFTLTTVCLLFTKTSSRPPSPGVSVKNFV